MQNYYIGCDTQPTLSANNNLLRCSVNDGATLHTGDSLLEIFQPPITTDDAFAIGAALWFLFLVCYTGKKYIEMLRFH